MQVLSARRLRPSPSPRPRARIGKECDGLCAVCVPADVLRGVRRGATEEGATMIVWLNGSCGAGKTSTAGELLDLIPGSVLYDPELIGRGLRRLLPPKRLGEVDDYQDLPSWR